MIHEPTKDQKGGVAVTRLGRAIMMTIVCENDYQAMEIFDLLRVWSVTLNLKLGKFEESDK
jgi:hypothetical protein